MHTHDTASLLHEHAYFSGHERERERRTWRVVLIAACMMVAEIACGIGFNSMALLADGWHMSTHAGALAVAALAYLFARRQAANPRFTFGTGKVGALGGFTSAVILAMIALAVIAESLRRLYAPTPIVFNEAIPVAALGLLVNLVSAWLLKDDHPTDTHDHPRDHNLHAAYMHVLADAFTSVLAIVALLLGKYKGWIGMDPLMGIVGSGVILHWSARLLAQTGGVLLDSAPDGELAAAIRAAIEKDSDNQVTDLHLWRIAPGGVSAIISLVTDDPRPPQHYKALLAGFHPLVHVTVEVNRCG